MENLEEKIKRLINEWREKNNDFYTNDAEIVRRILENIGIMPGATVEIANNKSGKGTIVLRIEFQPKVPVEFIEHEFIIQPKKKRRKRLS
jgi:Fe2+ transport system protein FeoA